MQRCDAKRPCTTCILGKGISECVYDNENDPQSADVYPSNSADDHPSGQHLGGADLVEIPTVTSARSSAELNLIHSTSDTTRVVIHEPPALQVFRTDRVPHGRSLGPAPVRRSSFEQHISLNLNLSISVVSSFLLPTLPPELRIPLSFLGEEKLQVQFSETDVTDLDMRGCVLGYGSSATNSPSDISRLWVLIRLPKFGVKFNRRRLDALIRGDQSGTVLHPLFVCATQVYGMQFIPGVDNTPAMVMFCARRTQVGWEHLAELFKGKDDWVKLQATLLIASGYIFARMTQMGLLYIQKGCDLIKVGKLQFVPTCGRPPEFSEELHEILVSLSQTMYWANYLFLMCGGPEPHATYKLEKEFRHELPVGEIASIVYIELIFCYSKLIRFSSRSVP